MIGISVANLIAHCYYCIGTFVSRYKPSKSQLIEPDFLNLTKQVFGFWFFAALWYMFGVMGSDPIRKLGPDQVTQETAELYSDKKHYNLYHFLWMWLIIVIMTHFTINL